MMTDGQTYPQWSDWMPLVINNARFIIDMNGSSFIVSLMILVSLILRGWFMDTRWAPSSYISWLMSRLTILISTLADKCPSSYYLITVVTDYT